MLQKQRYAYTNSDLIKAQFVVKISFGGISDPGLIKITNFLKNQKIMIFYSNQIFDFLKENHEKQIRQV